MSVAFDQAQCLVSFDPTAMVGPIAAYVIYDLNDGSVRHFELFSTSDVDEDRLADAMIRCWEHLVTEYPVPHFDVGYGLYPSVDAFFTAFSHLVERPVA